MINFNTRTVAGIVLSTIFLSSCHKSISPAMPHPPSSPEQKACASRCIHSYHHCSKQYEKIYQQCVMQAGQQAQLNYRAYLRNQLALKKKRKDVKKTYSDFYNVRHCEQQLACRDDYLRCYKNCGL